MLLLEQEKKKQASEFFVSLSFSLSFLSLNFDGKKTLHLTLLLQHLGGDRHRRVDRVRDHVQQRPRARVGARGDQVAHDPGVDLEQVVARHARLARDPSRDDDDVAALERLVELVGARVARHDGLGVDVGEVGGDSRGAGDVVEGQLGDEGVDLRFGKKGERRRSN